MSQLLAPSDYSIPSQRKSWQKITKFREHLSAISATSSFHFQVPSPIRTHDLDAQSSSKPQVLKSAWSPITPTPRERLAFARDTSTPPVPPLPTSMSAPMPQTPPQLHHASHIQPVERERDVSRDVERARAEAAEKLERGARERMKQEQEERDQLKREREREREQLESERSYQGSRQGVDSSLYHDEKAGPSSARRYRDSTDQHNQSFAQRSKSALARLSKAVFRFPATPATPASPFPRDHDSEDFLPHHIHRPSRSPRLPQWPSRASELMPWRALDVHKREESVAGSQPGAGQTHYHYYNHPSAPGSTSGHDPVEQHEHNVNVYTNTRDSKKKRSGECAGCHNHKKRGRRTNIWCILIFIILLLLLGNVIYLNVKYFGPNSTSVSSDPGTVTVVNGTTRTATQTASITGTRTVSIPQTTGTATSVSQELTTCLSQFESVGSSAASYPCSQCIPHLTSVANDLVDGTSPPVSGQGRVLQFCALQAVSNLVSSSNGTKPLENVGWLKDNSPCTWNGVTCDNKGRVSNLELVAPGVPSTIPDEMVHLVGMTKLTVTGDTNLPAGSPAALFSIPSLNTLSLDSTGLQGSLSGNELGGLVNLTQLILVKNSDLAIGPTIGGAANLKLQGLILTFQGLSNSALETIMSSTNLQQTLTTLDLSSNSLNGEVPATIASFPNLVELHLANNGFSALPASFPPKLTVLTMSGNTVLSGSLTTQTCSAFTSAAMTTCNFVNTAVTLGPGVSKCGPCQL